jgi:hypothetical protein
VRNCQRADGDGAVRSADKRVDVERLDVLAELGGQLGTPAMAQATALRSSSRPPDPGSSLANPKTGRQGTPARG